MDEYGLEGAFKLLSKPIRRALVKRGFHKPTEPQNSSIPLILKGENVLLIAPTASGKTEAALLPVFSMFIESARNPGIKILYITPLRALNRDMLERFEWWGNELDIKVAVRHGDTAQSERASQARSPPDLLITTPETLQAILSGRVLRRHLLQLRWVIIDEVHELAEDKRGSQLTLALERLRYIVGRDFQIIGLSATIGTPEAIGRFLVGIGRPVKIVRVPVARTMKLKVIYPSPEPADYELAAKLYTHPEVASRLRLIRHLMEKYRSVLLFVNTRAIAEVLSSRFKVWDINFPISIHHGSLSKPSRIAAERGLKDGDLKGLVCTSSLELGIDVGHIDLVIQYMSPRQVTRLIQRVGRAGHRIGLMAKGVIITSDPDDTLEALVICRKALNEELEPLKIPEKPYDVLCHQIAALLMLRKRWYFNEILELYSRAYPYGSLNEKDLIKVLTYMHTRYPRFLWASFEDKVVLSPRNRRALYEYFFDKLSMIPDVKNYLVINSEDNVPLGVLDEVFVAEYGDPGRKFIFRGSVWKIREVIGDKIYVSSVEDPTGAIPSWVGEEIPVPLEVAREVGKLRGYVELKLTQNKTLKEIIRELSDKYPADEETFRKALKEVEEHVRLGIPVPTDKRVLVEKWEEFLIIHTHLGTLANRALARILADLLAEILGHSVGVQQDPYRVVIHVSRTVK
ncbi:MAG: DEAD/DEAH box helicase, partial [archaeon GB-1867-097]|nr:DEAD/DEAH box helicase [Candidatus Culexmicrobium thermophilum]